MLYFIIIAILATLLVAFGIYHVFCMKRNAVIIAQAYKALKDTNEKLTKLTDQYGITVEHFAERLDIHAKNLDGLTVENQKLHEELTKTDIENASLKQEVVCLRSENNILAIGVDKDGRDGEE